MLIGQTIGPFTIEREIGSGAMGTVYLAAFAKDGALPTPVAIKMISVGLLGNEGAMARFDREAAILKQLRHPHVVRLLAVGKFRKTPFIAMEYVEGESLDRTLARRGKLAWEDVVEYGKQLCDALQHAHDKGIIHRDLKPSNLMVNKAGTLKLTDFGIAKDTDVTALTGANSTIGTAAYMSPEQCRGDKTLGPKSDLYSLGVCLYELVTGKKPFVADSTIDMFMKQVGETPVRPRKLEPDVPIWLDNLIMFLLEKDKANRPIDAGTVGRLLAEIEEKVQAQQSVGEEVAHARKVDRPVGGAPLDAADRDAAKSMLGDRKKKKKKKKGKPLHRRPWVRATPLVVGLLILLGVAGYLTVGSYFRDVPAAEAFAQVEGAPPGARLEAAKAFLAKYPTADEATAAKARDIFTAESAAVAELGLVKRHANKMKLTEGYDPDGYAQAMLALDAEADGDLKRAAELWAAIRTSQPPADPTKLTTEGEVLRCRLGWVAEKRLREIQVAAPAAVKQLQDAIATDRLTETRRETKPGTPEELAAQALRLEQFGDRTKARTKWDALYKQTARDPDERAWALAAVQRRAATPEPKDKDADAKERLLWLGTQLAAMEQQAKVAETAPNPGPLKRDLRNAARDLLDLYADETGPDYDRLRARAKALLESLGK